MKRLGLVLLLAGCATTPVTPKGTTVRERLEALPRCEAGAEVGALGVRASLCTKKHCQEACCNQCSWAATFVTKNGQPVPADAARVQALLGVTESALDCEIVAWGEALAGQSLAIEPGCVVR